MASSPIYGWAEPDNGDLVKNGALAIRTLGDAIDTTMATMTPKSTYTAKGSIAAASAANTPANLSVGLNGSVLVADSSNTTGLRWTNTPSASNPVLNSAMQVAQRGTTFTNASTATYTLDRWQGFRGAAKLFNVSQQATSDTTNLPFIQYCARMGRPSGNTDLQAVYFSQSLESLNSRYFASKTVTISFYARAGANFSAASNALNVELVTGTGTDQNVISGFTGAATVVSQTATLTTTWQRFSYVSSALSSSMTQLGMNFIYTPVGTAGANDYFEVTGVQIDVASVALPFRTAAVSYQEELAMCQRYYFRSISTATNALLSSYGMNNSTTLAFIPVQLPTSMRTKPVVVDYANIELSDFVGEFAISALVIDAGCTPNIGLVQATSSGLTQFRPNAIRNDNNAAGYIGFSAEL